MYCSSKCRAADLLQAHQTECVLLPFVWSALEKKLDLLALRLFATATRHGYMLHRLLDHNDFSSPFERTPFSPNKRFKAGKYKNIHRLEDNFEKLSLQEQMERASLAAVYLYSLKQTTYFNFIHRVFPNYVSVKVSIVFATLSLSCVDKL